MIQVINQSHKGGVYTLASPVEFSGVGLHSGVMATLKVTPSSAGRISFVIGGSRVALTYKNIIGSSLGTDFLFNGGRIRTIEHLLSALVGVGINSVDIHIIEGDEIPILDGSSSCFVDKFISAGLVLIGYKSLNRFRGDVFVGDPSKYIRVYETGCLHRKMDLKIDFNNKVTRGLPMGVEYTHSFNNYVKSVADCRTFCFESDIDSLKSKGLIKGGSLFNAIVISDSKVINSKGLRSDDEIVMHKLLDLIGDLQPLIDGFVGFKIEAYKTGHQLNNKLLSKVFSKRK